MTQDDSCAGLIKSRVPFEEPPAGANMAKCLLEAFKRHSGRVLLVDVARDQHLTGAMLYDKIGRIATNLIEKFDFEPGQVALTSCDHSGSEILMVLGLVMAGGAIYGSNINDGYSEERVLCKLVRPDLFICSSRVHDHMVRLRAELGASADAMRIVWVDNPLEGLKAGSELEEMEAMIKRDRVVLLDELIADEPRKLNEQLLRDVVYRRIEPQRHVLTYMLTSGSTGRPKVVRSTHEELMYGLYSMISATNQPPEHKLACDHNNNVPNDFHHQPEEPAWISGKRNFLLPMDQESVFAGDLPLDHGAGINTMFLSIYKGSKFIIMSSYQVDVFWQSVNDHRITSSIASTTFTYKLFSRLKELIDSGDHKRWDLSCFRHIACCGSKMAFADLAREIQRVYGNMNVCQCYGATEMGFMSMLPIGDCATHLNSIGYLFPGMEAKVVDSNSGKLCGYNERGQLHIRSKSKFKEYMCHPDDDPRQMIERCHDQQGFYMTGDQVHFDPHERLYIHGRIKDTLFLMQDWKILPEELEETVNLHQLVEFSAVVGVPDKDLPGCDSPKAFVKLIELDKSAKYQALASSSSDEDRKLLAKLKAGEMDFIAQDIYNFVAERTAKPKHLKGGVRILEEFPRVGLLNKIDRKVLRQME